VPYDKIKYQIEIIWQNKAVFFLSVACLLSPFSLRIGHTME
jgi:hypothetical protein